MKYYAKWAGEDRVVEIQHTDDGLVVLVDDKPFAVDVASIGASGLLNLIVDGHSLTYAARFENDVAHLSFHDRDVSIPIEDARTHLAKQAMGDAGGAAAEASVMSQMPGVVKEIRVEAGQAVAVGEPLLILEAMKMENEIRASMDGIVDAIHVEPGVAVDKGALLVSLTDSADEPTAEAAGT